MFHHTGTWLIIIPYNVAGLAHTRHFICVRQGIKSWFRRIVSNNWLFVILLVLNKLFCFCKFIFTIYIFFSPQYQLYSNQTIRPSFLQIKHYYSRKEHWSLSNLELDDDVITFIELTYDYYKENTSCSGHSCYFCIKFLISNMNVVMWWWKS